MYEAFYHLSEHPFGTTPDPRFLYGSRGHRRALAYICRGVFEKKGFLAVTGEVGVGKTTVIRAVVHTFHPCLEVAFVLNTKIGFDDMLYLILQDFGCRIEDRSKVGMLSTLNAYLINQFAQNQNPVLIIDEAQNLSSDEFEELRLLSNLETDSEKLIQIVLVGQPELEEKLNWTELRQLKQRIPGILRVESLERAEVIPYIQHRLRVAGLKNGRLRFTEGAVEAVCHYSAGIPRLINMICDRALTTGCMIGQTVISEAMVEKGAKELLNYPSHDAGTEGGRR